MFGVNYVDAQHQADLSPLLLLRPRSIRIYAPLDLGQTLLMLMDHADHTDDATDCDGHDRHQQTAESKEAINEFVHASPFRHAAIPNRFSGGADRDRTGGLLVANQALSQLSYSPNCAINF
jgi:hypothetical protein